MDEWLWIENYRLQITDYRLQIVDCRLHPSAELTSMGFSASRARIGDYRLGASAEVRVKDLRLGDLMIYEL